MVCVSFTSLLLGLSLCLVALGDSIALAHPVIDTLANHDHVFEANNNNNNNNNKELGVLDAAAGSKRLRGRKTGAIDESSTTEKEVMEGRKKTGARPYVGKCGSGGIKGELSLECVLREGRGLPSAKLVALISISSDYHPAKTHPPKNN